VHVCLKFLLNDLSPSVVHVCLKFLLNDLRPSVVHVCLKFLWVFSQKEFVFTNFRCNKTSLIM